MIGSESWTLSDGACGGGDVFETRGESRTDCRGEDGVREREREGER